MNVLYVIQLVKAGDPSSLIASFQSLAPLHIPVPGETIELDDDGCAHWLVVGHATLSYLKDDDESITQVAEVPVR